VIHDPSQTVVIQGDAIPTSLAQGECATPGCDHQHPCPATESMRQPDCGCGPYFFLEIDAMFLGRQGSTGTAPTYSLSQSTATLDTDPPSGDVDDWAWSVGPLANPPATILTNPYDDSNRLMTAPRWTFGMLGESGLGIRGRYLRLDSAVGTFAAPPSLGTTTIANNTNGLLGETSITEAFEAETIDVEGILDFELGSGKLIGFAGLRYGQFEDLRSSTATGRIRTGAPADTGSPPEWIDTFSTANYDFSTQQGAAFEGSGPTLGITAIMPFLSSRSISVFGSLRGTALYGEAESLAVSSSLIDSMYVSGQDIETQRLQLEERFYLWDIEVGAQWSRCIRFMDGRVFARAGIECQFWRGSADRVSATSSVADYNIPGMVYNNSPPFLSGIGTTSGEAVAESLNFDFNLVGLMIGTGVIW
jgi:hypothetical protein